VRANSIERAACRWGPVVAVPNEPGTSEGHPAIRAGVLIGSAVAAWLWTILVATHVTLPKSIRTPVLFVHLAALVLGFGSVLVSDLIGMLWLTGRKTVHELVNLLDVLQVAIWFGFELLVVSGAFLTPDLEKSRVQIKMVLVLVAAINGLWAHSLSGQLRAATPVPGKSLIVKVVAAGAVSQLAWWGATIVGFLSTMSRSH
jgi:hypothetical protein